MTLRLEWFLRLVITAYRAKKHAQESWPTGILSGLCHAGQPDQLLSLHLFERHRKGKKVIEGVDWDW